MDNLTVNKKSLLAAVIAAGVLLAGSGVGYRVLAGRLSHSDDDVRIIRGSLDRQFPLQLEDWTGKNAPLEENLIRATNADDYLNRFYTRRAGTETVGLFISYGKKARDLMPHRPEVCYPGAGWIMKDKTQTRLTLKDGSSLDCFIFRFSRSGLDQETVTVLNYYIADGQFCPDLSFLRSKTWRGSAGIRHTAQIQITFFSDALRNSDQAVRSVSQFAVISAKLIHNLFPRSSS